MFPVVRMRRLRENPVVRGMVRETRISVDGLIAPLFVVEGLSRPEEIRSMPGQYRHTLKSLVRECKALLDAGVKAVILFGIPAHKDPLGSQAHAARGIIQQAMRAIRKQVPGMLVVGDVCLCEYTSHGHCGVIQGDRLLNDPTLEILARTAVSQAEAGAELIAPSDMMDGRVAAIREALDNAGFSHIPIMSYAAKYASGFYGPFRDAAESAPAFGDRSSYQMDPANIRMALAEVDLDLQEGADIVMIKPALAYLDVIKAVKETFSAPVAAYNVSGEYAMVKAAGANGWIDEKRVTLEMLTSITRAGADIILTYFAKDVAGWLK
ncbi:MAG: porphobilinogen synthase [Deltaproteobacteria bacterium]|nr:porphobilinogen synthase [Deltaproteobacteria bacterium]